MTTPFKDHFSGHADLYARYRPGYPDELFDALAALAPSRRLAWDAATGNGQAALGLAGRFEAVIANDASAQQIESARFHPRIRYTVGRAEEMVGPGAPVEPESVDLATVAQALHWFDFESFFDAVRRALRPGGVIAAWAYGINRVNDAVDHHLLRYYEDVVGPYWPPERIHVEQGYRSIPFPFERIDVPLRTVTMRWTLPAMLGLLRSWSATQGYIKATGRDPLPDLERDLAPAWGDPSTERVVEWPLAMLVGRKTAD
jgi:SAM-dependent methyltransferase